MQSNTILTGKTLLLLESLMNYYSRNINILTSIITQKNTGKDHP